MAHWLDFYCNRTMKINFLEDINPKLPKGGNLTIEPNKTNLVVGRNGSGKTPN
jgi:ABC-type multidrug transport system ATPase subunit